MPVRGTLGVLRQGRLDTAPAAGRVQGMDVAVRAIREGRLEASDAGPLLVVCDDADVLGGQEVLRKLIADVTTAIAQQRAQAEALHAACLSTPPAQLQAHGVHTISDLFSDPCGWISSTTPPEPVPASCSANPATSSTSSSTPVDWQAFTCSLDPAAVGQPGRKLCVIIDDLSSALQRHGTQPVMQLLRERLHHPDVSAVLTLLHEDLHQPQDLAAVHSLAAHLVQLQPLAPLQRQLLQAATGANPHGALRCCSKRRGGRLRVEQQFYSLTQDGGLLLLQPPPDFAVSVKALVNTSLGPVNALQAPGKSKVSAASASAQARDPTQQQRQQQGSAGGAQAGPMAPAAAAAAGAAGGPSAAAAAPSLPAAVGSMRLGVSQQEAAARGAVVLPFEHQGQARPELYMGDARQYLPAAAGGHAPGTHSRSAPAAQAVAGVDAAGAGGVPGVREGPGGNAAAAAGALGRILYVRDSDEEHDSDEDPDDDLDI